MGRSLLRVGAQWAQGAVADPCVLPPPPPRSLSQSGLWLLLCGWDGPCGSGTDPCPLQGVALMTGGNSVSKFRVWLGELVSRIG